MAVCRRCGSSFDRKKTDGICPKCAFYNRPKEQAWEDTSWLKNYNVEDNTYIPPKVSWDPESYNNTDRLIKKGKNGRKGCDVEGSHVHTSSSNKTSTLNKRRNPSQNKKEAKGCSGCLKVIVVVVIMFLASPSIIRQIVPAIYNFFQETIHSFNQEESHEETVIEEVTSEKENNNIQWEFAEITMDEAKAGFEAGDVTYQIKDIQTFTWKEIQDKTVVAQGQKCYAIDIDIQQHPGEYGYISYEYCPYLTSNEEDTNWDMYNNLASYDYEKRQYEFQKKKILMKNLGKKIDTSKFFQVVASQGYALYCVDENVKDLYLCCPSYQLDKKNYVYNPDGKIYWIELKE